MTIFSKLKLKRMVKQQGENAERCVSYWLHNLGQGFYVFDNILINTPKGTTQIDHIVISIYGIFVIETKSHKGYIVGDIADKYWSQFVYYGSFQKRNSLYNPVCQNTGHIRALSRLLGLNFSFFENVVVFTNPYVSLDFRLPSNVIYLNQLYEYISRHCIPRLTLEMVNHAYNTILSSNLDSRYYENKHVKYVESLRGK